MKTNSSGPDRVDLAKGADSPSLLTRDQGKALRTLVLGRLQTSEMVTLDLSGALALSPSFADELFAGIEKELDARFAERVRISGAKREWQRLISSALQHRRMSPAGRS